MSRRRLGTIAGAIAVAFALSAVSVMAQDQNRGGRGGGPGGGFNRGGGPGGPGGFRGGFGGGGTSLLDLAGREAIQTDLNITDEQKTKIQALATEARARRDKVMQQMRDQMRRNDPNGGRGGNTGRGGRQGAITPTPGPASSGVILRASYQPQQGFGVGGFSNNPFVQQQPVDPAVQQQMIQNQQRLMQNQQRMMQNQQRMQGFQQMRQATDKLRKDEEAALAKILDAKQMKRLREIALQLEGPYAILRNQELARKLSVNPEQMDRIREIQQKESQSGANPFQAMRGLMEKFRATQPQDQAQGQNAAGGQQQGRGGRGGFANFDREAFQKFMEQPDSQATVKQMHDDQLAQRDAGFSKVLKVLDRGQASKYRNMLGEKYDTTALARGFMGRMLGGAGGPGGPGGPGAPAPAAGNAPAAAAPAPAAANAPAAAAPASAASNAPAAAPAASNSLRARRGLGSGAQPR